VPGASDAYVGGIVAYSDEIKEAQLGVPREVLAAYGAVSAETAESMAAGAQRVLRADVGASVTGIAGPGGGTAEKPVGLVYLHVSAKDDSEAVRLELPGDRDRIRGRATAWLLHQLRRVLSRSDELSA
jgi:PncC family amidohydrolase